MPLRLFRSRNVTGANLVMAPARRRVLRDVLPRRALPAGASSATARSRSASRSCPSCIVMGTLSLGFAERLIMGFGPRRDADRRASSPPAPGLLLFARAPVDGDLRDRRPAGDAAARHRRRPRVPGADDAGDVGRHRRATPAWRRASSTRPSRSAARSASPCSRRSRPSAPTRCAPTASRDRRRAQLRLPPRLPDRRGADRGGDRRRRIRRSLRGARRRPRGRRGSDGDRPRSPTRRRRRSSAVLTLEPAEKIVKSLQLGGAELVGEAFPDPAEMGRP